MWLWLIGGAIGAYLLLREERKQGLVLPLNISSVPSGAKIAPVTSPPAAPASSASATPAATWVDHVSQAGDLVLAHEQATEAGSPADLYMSAVQSALEAPIDTLTLQRDLNLLGATPPLVEDGIMGPKTIAAIKDFQTANDLPATGILDKNTNYVVRYSVGEHANTQEG